MDVDEIEIPVSKILYRQSSIETRLLPINLSDEDLSDDEANENILPKVVNIKEKKIPPPPPSRKCSNVEAFDKSKFTAELQNKLMKKTSLTGKFPTEEQLESAFKDKKPERRTSKNVVINENIVQELRSKIATRADDVKDEGKVDGPNDNKTIQDIELKLNKAGNDEVLIGHMKALELKKKEIPIEEDENRVGGPLRKDEMASSRPKSPKTVGSKTDKDESIWDKIGTLGRKKRIKEVQEVQAEGKYAIDSPGNPTPPVIPPEEYNLDDFEERCMIDPKAFEDPRFDELVSILIDWINDELASQRIIVQQLAEDLYDGQVLQKLLEKLTGDKLDVPEVTQSEEGQKQKLNVVLSHFNQVLGIYRQGHNKWSVEAIHSKNVVAIIHLLVALARHFRPPVRLPEHVTVNVVVVQKQGNQLVHKTLREKLTAAYDDVGMRCERDAFDTLFDHAPDKLKVVKKSLVTFVNKHLNKMNFEVTELESQFHDGVYLIMLMGLLEGFFVPHYSFHLTPHEFDQKVHNVAFAFELMEEVALQTPKARPEDVVNMDLKSTLRVLYNLFLKYKEAY